METWSQEEFLRRVVARAEELGLKNLREVERRAGISEGSLQKGGGRTIEAIYKIAGALEWTVPELLGYPLDEARLARALRIAARVRGWRAEDDPAALAADAVRAYRALETASKTSPSLDEEMLVEPFAAALRGVTGRAGL
jgi:hypothetical protein